VEYIGTGIVYDKTNNDGTPERSASAGRIHNLGGRILVVDNVIYTKFVQHISFI
jgi:hypothetical protein